MPRARLVWWSPRAESPLRAFLRGPVRAAGTVASRARAARRIALGKTPHNHAISGAHGYEDFAYSTSPSSAPAPPAGRLSRRAAGKRALLIEGRPLWHDCARGCMPSKLLIAAAEAAHAAMHTDAFGVRVEGEVSADGKAVMDRVTRARPFRRLRAGRRGEYSRRGQDPWPGALRVGQLRVDEHAEIQARVVIATGSPVAACATWRPACRERRCVRLGRSAAPRGRVRPRRDRTGAGSGAGAPGRRGAGVRRQRQPGRHQRPAGARAPARSSSASSTWIRTPACWKPGASAMRSRCATWRWTTASAPSALTMRWSPPAAAPTWTGWAWSTPRWH